MSISINRKMSITDAFKRIYESTDENDTKAVDAMREIFAYKGIETIFSYPLLCEALKDKGIICDSLFEVFESGAIESIREATRDPYSYREFFREAQMRLTSYGVCETDAHKALFIFYDTFGFPINARIRNIQVIEEEKSIYVGQTKDGVRHGRGHDDRIYNGEVFYQRDGLWINGEVYGYLRSENDLGSVDHSFCIKGRMKGKDTLINMNGEVLVKEY